MGTLPAELQALLDQIDACERDAESLLAGLDDDGVNWHPSLGGWSIAQCLQHLAVMNDIYTQGCDEHLRAARGKKRGPVQGAPSDARRPLVRPLHGAAASNQVEGAVADRAGPVVSA